MVAVACFQLCCSSTYRAGMLLIFLLILQTLSTIQAQSDKCKMLEYVGILCRSKVYKPMDIISEANYKSVDMNFVTMLNEMHLKIPENYSSVSMGEYKSFSITDSCVGSIEENYFQKLDRNKKILKTIKFSKVKCLQTLKTESFRGIGSFVEKMYFEFMPNLTKIEDDFFDTFLSLKKLTISNTNVFSISERILTVLPNLMILKVNNNNLMSFPFIPLNKYTLVPNFQGFGNPFHCNCSIMNFINVMTEEMKKQDYKCFTPLNLRDKHLSVVGDLCFSTTSHTEHVKSDENIAKAHLRIEVIIAVAISLLLIVIIVFIIIICKQKRKKPQEKIIHNGSSPSKIIFHKFDQSEPLFQRKDVMI